ADVTLVSGPVDLEASHPRIQKVSVTTAEDMYQKMHEYFPSQDIVIKAGAVSDYRPKITYDEKMKKQAYDLHIKMERTKDILQSLGKEKEKQFLVGFAAETTDPIYYE